jgi:hypothetical protein
MTEQQMLHEMCSCELAQADLKAIGQSRGFDAQTIASRELLRHVFLSEQGVATALSSLTEPERLGLHLLSSLGGATDVEFFQRLYPDAVSSNRYGTYTERYKGLFQEIRTRLVRRGVLLFGTLPDTGGLPLLERRRFHFPFTPFLPAPFRGREVGSSVARHYRGEVLRNKLEEILLAPNESAIASKHEQGCWRLVDGELLFSGHPFSARGFLDWHVERWKAAVPYNARGQAEALQPIPLLLYAVSRLRDDEWLAPADLLPLWNIALPRDKAPEPQVVCDAGYQCACLERVEHEGTCLYRRPRQIDTQADAPPCVFLDTRQPEAIAVSLELVPLAALERLCAVSRFEVAGGRMSATPHFLKLSHAPAQILADPMLGWLREQHSGFHSVMETVEQRQGKLIVHENLLVARVRDLGLKVLLERRFGGPGQLVALAEEFVAFPTGLLPEIQSWMKKSGHVIKYHKADGSHQS